MNTDTHQVILETEINASPITVPNGTWSLSGFISDGCFRLLYQNNLNDV